MHHSTARTLTLSVYALFHLPSHLIILLTILSFKVTINRIFLFHLLNTLHCSLVSSSPKYNRRQLGTPVENGSWPARHISTHNHTGNITEENQYIIRVNGMEISQQHGDTAISFRDTACNLVLRLAVNCRWSRGLNTSLSLNLHGEDHLSHKPFTTRTSSSDMKVLQQKTRTGYAPTEILTSVKKRWGFHLMIYSSF